MSNIAPIKEKLKIHVKRISNNAILVETTAKKYLERELKSEKLVATGFATGLLAEKKPMIIIYDVPTVDYRKK